ncbi:hypothetical protein Droror1_Dr00022446 [Drosera rotundifolia]
MVSVALLNPCQATPFPLQCCPVLAPRWLISSKLFLCLSLGPWQELISLGNNMNSSLKAASQSAKKININKNHSAPTRNAVILNHWESMVESFLYTTSNKQSN